MYIENEMYACEGTLKFIKDSEDGVSIWLVTKPQLIHFNINIILRSARVGKSRAFEMLV